MPFYPGDFVSATSHLSAAETGALMLLLAHAWLKGKLPSDDKILSRIARMSERQWASAKPPVKEFFSDDWVNFRLEKERAKALEKTQARIESGSRGGHAKALKSREGGLAKASGLPGRLPQQTDQQNDGKPLPFSPEPDTTSVVSEKRVQERASFGRFWSVFPNKVGKPAAEKAFAKVADEIDAILAGVDAYVRDKPPDRPWLNPATFLNQRRWEDAPAPGLPSTRQPTPHRTRDADFFNQQLGLNHDEQSPEFPAIEVGGPVIDVAPARQA
jgi:uncharacterized protein YdaU (DUF1376 family)